MEAINLIANSKNKVLNIAIIIMALIVASNIYKNQNKALESAKTQRADQIKKNEVLLSISGLEKKVTNYKNILNKKDLSKVINTLTNIARDSNVKVISIEPRPPENYSAYVKHPFNLNISVASYHAIGKFVSKIENYSDIFSVDRANILITQKSTESEQGYKLSVNLVISTVVLKN